MRLLRCVGVFATLALVSRMCAPWSQRESKQELSSHHPKSPAFVSGRGLSSALRRADHSQAKIQSRQSTQQEATFSRSSVAEQVTREALFVPSAGELRKLIFSQQTPTRLELPSDVEAVEAAYESCRLVTEEHSKTFFLASRFLAPDEQKAIWAIYDWCRVTDEMVDGPKAATTTMLDLEAWQEQLHSIWRGDSDDSHSAALVHAVRRFSLIEKPFEDMVAGMAMDLTMERYETFHDLEVYCYRVAGTVGLMSLPVIGTDPRLNLREKELTIAAAMSLGTALQLTNILRDIGEDARRGRIYVPLEDLARFGITEEEVLEASHTVGLLYHEDRWKEFMEFQIRRCLEYYRSAEYGIIGLSESNQMGVMAALFVYEGILTAIRENNYDNLSQRAFVPDLQKVVLCFKAWLRLNELRSTAAENVKDSSSLGMAESPSLPYMNMAH